MSEESKKNLPRAHKGRRLTKEEKIVIAESVCDLYKEDRYTLESILDHHGIKSDATWYKWIREHKEIKDLYLEAQNIKAQVYRGKLQTRARTSIEKMISGYIIETTKTEKIPTGNDESEIVTKVKVEQQYIKPSPTLILFALNNTDQFKRNNDTSFSQDGTSIPTKIEVNIINQNPVSPVLSEDDIDENIDEW